MATYSVANHDICGVFYKYLSKMVLIHSNRVLVFAIALLFGLINMHGVRAQSQLSDVQWQFQVEGNLTRMAPQTRNINRDGLGAGWGFGLRAQMPVQGNLFVYSGLSVVRSAFAASIDSGTFLKRDGGQVIAPDVAYRYQTTAFRVPCGLILESQDPELPVIVAGVGVHIDVLMSRRARVDNLPAVFDPDEYFDIMKVRDYVTNGTQEDRISRFRAGLHLMLGTDVELGAGNKVRLAANLDTGLSDVVRGNAVSARQSAFFISAAYTLGR